jgi:hypothetical protein
MIGLKGVQGKEKFFKRNKQQYAGKQIQGLFAHCPLPIAICQSTR